MPLPTCDAGKPYQGWPVQVLAVVLGVQLLANEPGEVLTDGLSSWTPGTPEGAQIQLQARRFGCPVPCLL